MILIGGGDPQTLGNVFAIIPRPFRLAELFDCIQRALSRPYLSRCLPPPGLRLTEKEAAIFACLAAAAFTAMALTASAEDVKLPPASTKTGVTYASDMKAIFDASCVKCHSGDRPKARLHMDTLEGILKIGRAHV